MIPSRPLSFSAALLPGMACLAVLSSPLPAVAQESPPAIPRLLPPPGIEIPAEWRGQMEARLKKMKDDWWDLESEDLFPDVAVYHKAVDFALEHGEFYDAKKDFVRAERLLDLADERLRAYLDKRTPWTTQKGLLVRGYESRVDESIQPYGLEIPEKLDLSKPVPLLIWLHGRGDKQTDLHFIHDCLAKSQALGGKIKDQQECLVLHAFGRQCVGWKNAGEVDVFEALEHVRSQYPIDEDRIALAGFSMGGAGAWHIGVHHADRFCAVHPGAGFADTAAYNKLTPEKYPPWHEQKLWGLYDAPASVRNLFNTRVIAYSGEEDKQKQAADQMEAAFKAEGGSFPHVVGAKMGHKYDDASAARVWEFLKESFREGRVNAPAKVELQTRTLKYPRMHWVEALSLKAHWEDSRVTAEHEGQNYRLATKNITSLRLRSPDGRGLGGATVSIDGQTLPVGQPALDLEVASAVLVRDEGGQWSWGSPSGPRKKHQLQGPIDDAFMDSFLVVNPFDPSPNDTVSTWVGGELEHFRARWRALMRGRFREKESRAVGSPDMAGHHVILWGDPSSNEIIRDLLPLLPVKIEWTPDKLALNGRTYDARTHVPVLILPNPVSQDRYLVINSGLTFREAHDKTNSQQNPKLPDWAVLDLTQPPDASSPGKVVAAGFFDEHWKFQPPTK